MVLSLRTSLTTTVWSNMKAPSEVTFERLTVNLNRPAHGFRLLASAAVGHRLVGESHIVLDGEALAPVTDVSRDVTRLRVDGVAADAAPGIFS